MPDEKRLHELLDLVEQARAEGDTETEAKATAAYKKESAPQSPVYQGEDPLSYKLMRGGREVARGVGMSGRSILNAFAGAPLMAADAGIAVRNLMSGTQAQLYNQKTNKYEPDPNTKPIPKENFESATSMWNRALDDAGVPKSQTTPEKISDIATQVLIGSKIPSPTIANPAPANFSKTSPVLIDTLKKSQNVGYVVPPSTTNPIVTNKVLESFGGKIATAQDAAIKNQDLTNSLAKRALGISDDAPLTQGALKAIRDEAGQAFEDLRSIGTMRADSIYAADLAKIGEKFKGAEKDFPELAKSEVTDLVESMNKKSFDSSSAVDAISILRDKATKAYAGGDATLGKAYRSISNALEGAIERSLERRGQDSAAMLKNFRSARQAIAKTYSVEGAFNASTGNVAATKLGQQLAKGKPLSGELKDIGRFGQAFPKAAQSITDSGSVRNTDVIVGAGTSALSKEPGWLMYPFLRMGARAGMLSPLGQKLAVPSEKGSNDIQAMIIAQLLANQRLNESASE